MKILHIVELDKKKGKVHLENGEAFALYLGEIKKYQLKEGMELEEDVYQEIVYDLLEKRARERMLYLLRDTDKTEKQIREKLMAGNYPKTAVEAAILFGKTHHYIDDRRYAEEFIRARGSKLSRKELEYKLMQKGISKEICQEVYELAQEEGLQEEAAIERLLQKKNVNFSEITPEEKQKIYAYFMRKGFSYDSILKKVNEFESRDT